MLLAIDCGNTNTVFSIWDGTKFLATWRTSTEWQRTADQYYVWLSTLMRFQNIDVTITDGAGNTVNVIITDVPASNGIIHVIDAVLLPTP